MADSRKKPDAPEPKKESVFGEVKNFLGRLFKVADTGIDMTHPDATKQSHDLLNKDDKGPKGPRPGGYGSTK